MAFHESGKLSRWRLSNLKIFNDAVIISSILNAGIPSKQGNILCDLKHSYDPCQASSRYQASALSGASSAGGRRTENGIGKQKCGLRFSTY